MIISDTAIRNKISVIVLAVIILASGIYSYAVLPRENAPDIPIPFVFVSTSYKGVSSSDIETSITIPIEKKLKSLDGVKEIKSVSSEGLSSINVEFITDIDIDDAVQKVKDKVDEAKSELPSDLEDDPAVFEINISEEPIVIYSLAGTCGNPCLKNLADDLQDDIESISGILEVIVTGGLEREIQIVVDPDKLAYYQIPIGQFQNIIYSENQNTSGGSITLGDGRYQLRVPGEFEKPEEIFNLVISSFNGMPVYLKDVANVVDTFKDESSRSRLDGNEAINIAIKKRIGENIISISDQIDGIVTIHQETWPSGTNITKLFDQSKDIRNMVADLENNILSGLILVIIVLFFILGFRNAVLVSLAIPFSMLLSFTILFFMGITLNVVVLFSLTLALGMIVDNAIVIIENIYRYMEQGVPRNKAAMKATAEVAWPVIGSTLTTLAAFSPMIFWPGIMGAFMKYLPITLIVTLSSSLFVALIINPTLTSIFMRVRNGFQVKIKKSAEEIASAGEKPAKIKGWLLTSYAAFLKNALRHRLMMIAISFAFLIILIQVWFLVVGLERPKELFPNLDPILAYVNFEPPEGADLEYNDRLAKSLEMAIAGNIDDAPLIFGNIKEEQYKAAYAPKIHKDANGNIISGPSGFSNIEHIYSKTVNVSGPENQFSNNTANHIGIKFIDMADREYPSAETLEKIRERINQIPGAVITVEKLQEGPPTGPPINIEISGENLIKLGEIAASIRNIIQQIPHVEDVQDDYQAGIPAIRVNIDRQKSALFGLTTDSIGFALKTAYNGLDVSTYYEDDDDYDITVTLAEKDRKKTDVLYKLMIPTPSGQLVPLTTIAKIDYTGIIGDIIRVDQKRVVTVKANVDESKTPGATARMKAEELLKNFSFPPGYTIEFTGEREEEQESEEFLMRAFMIAIFLIFFILVSLFNSVSQPLIILTSVILSLGGVFLGLTVISAPFGVIMTGVGVISLAGVVVNNAIVLIDYINKLVNRGIKVSDAIISAGATRLRPVLLTAVTTILGLIPMVTGVSYDFRNMAISWTSESTQWWQSMAIVVIFGLLIATFLTLVVVPCLYSLLYTSRTRTKEGLKWIKRMYWKPFETEKL